MFKSCHIREFLLAYVIYKPWHIYYTSHIVHTSLGGTTRCACQLIRCTYSGAKNSDPPVGVCQSLETRADFLRKPRSAASLERLNVEQWAQWNFHVWEVKPIFMVSHWEQGRHLTWSVFHPSIIKAWLYHTAFKCAQSETCTLIYDFGWETEIKQPKRFPIETKNKQRIFAEMSLCQ